MKGYVKEENKIYLIRNKKEKKRKEKIVERKQKMKRKNRGLNSLYFLDVAWVSEILRFRTNSTYTCTYTGPWTWILATGSSGGDGCVPKGGEM